MGILKQVRLGGVAVLGIPMIAVVALLALAWGHAAAQPTQADDSGPRMALNVTEGATCDAPSEPTVCDMDPGDDFTLAVEVVEAPSSGYLAMGTHIAFGSLTYSPTEQAVDEILIDQDGFPGIAVRSVREDAVKHGATAGFPPNFGASTFEGKVVEISMTCTETASSTQVELVPYSETNTTGSAFKLATERQENIAPKAAPLTINCGELPQTPEEAATATEAPSLPPTGGAGAIGDGGTNAGLWAIIGSLLAVAAAGLAIFTWRYVRVR